MISVLSLLSLRHLADASRAPEMVQVSEASLPRRAHRNFQTFMKMLSGQLLDGWKSSTPTPTPDPKCLLPGPVLSQYVDSPESGRPHQL